MSTSRNGGAKALIDIKNASVLQGGLPSKPLKLVLAWAEIHRDELMANWASARMHGQISKIEPLK